MKVVILAADVYEEEKKVSITLTHIPTSYFDDLVSLSASNYPSDLTLTELEVRLNYLFKPREPIVKRLIEFQDRVKLKSQ